MSSDVDDIEDDDWRVGHARYWGYDDAKAMDWAQVRLEALYGPRLELADGTVFLTRWTPRNSPWASERMQARG